jgi:DNA-directed RNA polymerase subunit RPC12/RpoP
MKCATCGTVLKPGERICGACGVPVATDPPAPASGGAVRCPQCGQEQKARYKFCIRCGHRLGEGSDEAAGEAAEVAPAIHPLRRLPAGAMAALAAAGCLMLLGAVLLVVGLLLPPR